MSVAALQKLIHGIRMAVWQVHFTKEPTGILGDDGFEFCVKCSLKLLWRASGVPLGFQPPPSLHSSLPPFSLSLVPLTCLCFVWEPGCAFLDGPPPNSPTPYSQAFKSMGDKPIQSTTAGYLISRWVLFAQLLQVLPMTFQMLMKASPSNVSL